MRKYSVGILIIGSLWWDSKDHRVSWRDERLELDSTVPVRVPIRYGRESGTHDGTYTMVFSNELSSTPNRMGWGLAVPCAKPVESFDDLLEEAKALWAAEQKRERNIKTISAKWGAVALLLNPASEGLETIKSKWTATVKNETGGFYRDPNDTDADDNKPLHSKFEIQVVSPDGFLSVEWPVDSFGEPLVIDLLLATANVPTLVDDAAYALPDEVALKWRQHPDRLRYFDENRRAGITTSDDYRIIKHLGRAT